MSQSFSRSISRRAVLAALAATATVPMLGSKARAASMEEIKKRGLIVATEDDFRPFEFVKDGKPTGFDNELIEDLRKYAPFEIKQEILPWTGILAGVSTGKYDVAITAAIITKERTQSLDFTSPIADATHYYLKRNSDTSIKAIKDLSGKTCGVQAGSALLGRLPELKAMLEKQGGTMGKIVEYTSYPEAYQDLALGRTDYVVNTIINLKALVIEKPAVFEVGQAVSGPSFPGLGGGEGQQGAARLPQRLHRQAEGDRPLRRVAEEMVRRGVREPAGSVRAGVLSQTIRSGG